MPYTCREPFSAMSRVIDIARRLDLPLSRFHLDQRRDGSFTLDFKPADETCQAARLFHARVAQLLDLAPETEDA